MNKRILILFSLIVASLCALSIRIVSVNAGEYAGAAVYNNSRTIPVANGRGSIYDCNLNPLINAEDRYAVALKPTNKALYSVTPFVGSERLRIIKDELSKGSPYLLYLPQKIDLTKTTEGSATSGTVFRDAKVIKYRGRYADNQYAAHLLGYVDADGNGVTGIEKCYNDYLNDGAGKLKAAFFVDAIGRNLGGTEIEVLDEGYSTSLIKGVALTIDLNVQKVIEDTISKYAWESGCAVALDPNTGAIRALASFPKFSPQNVADSLEAQNSPLLNKALQAYSVGSTFKVIVAAAAIEKDRVNLESDGNLPDSVFNCTGVKKVGQTEFGCFNKTAHGEETMQDALVNSCNTYFIDVAQRIGAEPILTLASNLGFGQKFSLCESIISKSGTLPTLSDLDSPESVANLGFGQGKLLATPLQLATAFAAVANGGYYIEPYVFEGFVDEKGNLTKKYPNRTNLVSTDKTRVMSASTSAELTSMLTEVVKSKDVANPSTVSAAGKTATAQSGQYKNGEEVCHTWFAGWYPANNPKLVIVLMKESGVTGISDCGPVFKNIVDSLNS